MSHFPLIMHVFAYFIFKFTFNLLTECTVSAAGSAGARAGHSTGADGHGLLVGAGKREGIFILLKITWLLLLQSFAKINHFYPLAKLIYLFKYLVLVQIIHGKKSDLLRFGHVISCHSQLFIQIFTFTRESETMTRRNVYWPKFVLDLNAPGR